LLEFALKNTEHHFFKIMPKVSENQQVIGKKYSFSSAKALNLSFTTQTYFWHGK